MRCATLQTLTVTALSAACLMACKKTPEDAPPTQRALTPAPDILENVPHVVRPLLLSERAQIVLKVDPREYEKVHGPLRQRTSSFNSMLPVPLSKQEDVWAMIGADGTFKVEHIARDRPAYAIFNVGVGQDLATCLDAMVLCPQATVSGAQTLTLLLPTRDAAALERDMRASLQDFGVAARALEPGYLQIDIMRAGAPEPLRYERAPARRATTAFAQALSAPGALSLWASARGLKYINGAGNWSQLYESLTTLDADDQTVSRLTMRGLDYINTMQFLFHAAVREHEDVSLTLREQEGSAHLDLLMTRTPLGAKLHEAASQPGPLFGAAIPDPSLHASVAHDLSAASALTPAWSGPALAEIMRSGGPLSYVAAVLHPHTMVELWVRPLLAQLGGARPAALDLTVGRASPDAPGAPGARVALAIHGESLDALATQVAASPMATSVYEGDSLRIQTREAQDASLFGEARAYEGLAVRVDFANTAPLSNFLGLGELEKALMQSLSSLGVVELRSVSEAQLFHWRLSLGEFVEPEAAAWRSAMLKPEQLGALDCAREDRALWATQAQSFPRQEALFFEQARTLDASLKACASAHPELADELSRQRAALTLHMAGLRGEQDFDSARAQACERGVGYACDDAQSAQLRVILRDARAPSAD